MAAIVGRADSSLFGSDSREERRWIGKPWRRVELLTTRTYWKGEEVDTARDLTFHFGLRWLGLAFTFIIVRQSCIDYSDETP
jgi:hypothetical protein